MIENRNSPGCRDYLSTLYQGNEALLKQFDLCASEWQTQFSAEQYQFLLRAVQFAADKHSQHIRRADRSPLLLHTLRVAHNLSQVGQVRDINLVSCGVLHHILDRKAATVEELKASFNAPVSRLLAEFDDEPSFGPGSQEEREAVIKRAPTVTAECKTLKLADILEHVAVSRDKSDYRRLIDQLQTANSHLYSAIAAKL